MDLEELRETFDGDVEVERTASTATGHDGTVRFTVTCDDDERERVRERLEEIDADVTFETWQ